MEPSNHRAALRRHRLRWSLYAPFYDSLVRLERQRRRSIALLRLRPGERVGYAVKAGLASPPGDGGAGADVGAAGATAR